MPDTPAPCLLDARQVEVHLQRLCREIVAAFGNHESLALLGIRMVVKPADQGDVAYPALVKQVCHQRAHALAVVHAD